MGGGGTWWLASRLLSGLSMSFGDLNEVLTSTFITFILIVEIIPINF